MDAYGSESPRGDSPTIVKDEFGAGEHDVADDTTIFLHHQVKFRDEVGISPKSVEDKMLGASWTIYVPESFTGEVFNLAIIAGLL